MKIITIVGARPQFIKAALVSQALSGSLKTRRPLQEIIVHTGQHYDYGMSGQFIDELNLKKPEYNLGVGSVSALQQVSIMVGKLESILRSHKPDLVLVYGDTNSTLAGAYAASMLHIRVAHIEAGLRSFDMSMPEEINRVVTDHLSSLLFCPTRQAVRNLEKENIAHNVYLVGDIMFELAQRMARIAERKSAILIKTGVVPREYILATLHRQSNVDNKGNLESIVAALVSIKMPIVLPLHPRTQKMLKTFGLFNRLVNQRHIKTIAPVGYLDMLMLEKNARKIMTDSGGVQKEAFFFKVPCVTLRDTTEWTETLENNWNVLAGTNQKKIVSLAHSTRKPGKHNSYYGDGKTSAHIIAILKRKAAQL